jgi:hypothetical protein
MSRRRYVLLGIGAVLAQVLVLALAALLQGVHDPIYFAHLGSSISPKLGITTGATDPIGYDGQFYYYMARLPGHLNGFDAPGLRYGRMLYPLLAGLLSVGQDALIPWALLAINVLAVAGTTVLLASMLARRGQAVLVSVVAVVYCGQLLPELRDLADPLAVFLMVAALWAALDRRWVLAAAFCALGTLTRETNLVVTVALLAPLLLARDWRRAAWFAAIALLPFAAWRGFLALWIHDAGLAEAIHAVFTPPTLFLALEIAVFSVLPVGIALVVSGGSLVRRLDSLSISLCVAGFATLFILQPPDHWSDPWGVFRVAAPVLVLLPLLLNRRALQWAALGLTFASLFVLVVS